MSTVPAGYVALVVNGETELWSYAKAQAFYAAMEKAKEDGTFVPHSGGTSRQKDK